MRIERTNIIQQKRVCTSSRERKDVEVGGFEPGALPSNQGKPAAC